MIVCPQCKVREGEYHRPFCEALNELPGSSDTPGRPEHRDSQHGTARGADGPLQARLRLAAGRVRPLPVGGGAGMKPIEALRIMLAFGAGMATLIVGFVAYVVATERAQYGGPR